MTPSYKHTCRQNANAHQIKIHHLIKTVEHISGINTLYINYYDCDNEHWQEISWEEAQKCEYAVPISGTHEIYIDVHI